MFRKTKDKIKIISSLGGNGLLHLRHGVRTLNTTINWYNVRRKVSLIENTQSHQIFFSNSQSLDFLLIAITTFITLCFIKHVLCLSTFPVLVTG